MLKIIFLIVASSVATLGSTINGQGYPDTFFDAISSNKGQVLMKFLDENVDMAILDKTFYATEVEASTRILNWVKTNNVTNVNRIYKGENEGGSGSYHLATANTDSGKVRIMVYSEKSDNNHLVKEIRIEKY